MRIKILGFFALLLIGLISSMPFVFSLTASIGNSRMVIRIAPGETIKKSILVKNVNDVPVNISLSVWGDLIDNIVLEESNFNLAPKDEKDFYFLIKADKEGSSETKINVIFTPEKGNSVGLSSTIIVLSKEEYRENNEIAGVDGFRDNLVDEKNSANDSVLSGKTIDNSVKDSKLTEKLKGNGTLILIIFTFILFFVLILLYFYSLTTKQRKRKITKENKRVTKMDE